MDLVEHSAPEWLTENDLLELGLAEQLPPQLEQKLERLLATPFINNQAYGRGITPKRPVSNQLGPFLRVLFWNIAQGEKLDEILLAFTDGQRFVQHLETSGVAGRDKFYHQLREMLALLPDVDLLILNEADLGLARSGYRDVALELAEALDMNFAFGVEFVEVAPLKHGIEPYRSRPLASWPGLEDIDNQELRRVVAKSDGQVCRGLHGNAILSRYPIRKASLLRYAQQGFDWYAQEKELFSSLRLPDQAMHPSVPQIHAMSFCQLRRGGRMALTVQLAVPQLPEGALTVVSTHLETRCHPSFRLQQIRELLEHLSRISHPVILAGDFNTSGRDKSPGLIHEELLKLAAKNLFWSRGVPKIAPVLGWLNDFLKGAPHLWMVERDPTQRGAWHQEWKLFEELEHFRFQDGGCFDFRGDRLRSVNRSTGTLANSNERAAKGFAATGESPWASGFVGRRKIDWILVKPYIQAPRDRGASYRFAPHFGRTLRQLNVGSYLSDHHPLLVDLPFEEPQSLEPRIDAYQHQ